MPHHLSREGHVLLGAQASAHSRQILLGRVGGHSFPSLNPKECWWVELELQSGFNVSTAPLKLPNRCVCKSPSASLRCCLLSNPAHSHLIAMMIPVVLPGLWSTQGAKTAGRLFPSQGLPEATGTYTDTNPHHGNVPSRAWVPYGTVVQSLTYQEGPIYNVYCVSVAKTAVK